MVSIELAPETKKAMQETPKLFSTAVAQGFRNALFLLEGKIKSVFGKGGNLKIRTGYLRRSIRTSVKQQGNEFIGTVGSNVKYAAIHEYGGIIRPKKAKNLVFKVGDRWIRTKMVKIPRRPFIGPVLKLSGVRTINDEITKEINKFMEAKT